MVLGLDGTPCECGELSGTEDLCLLIRCSQFRGLPGIYAYLLDMLQRSLGRAIRSINRLPLTARESWTLAPWSALSTRLLLPCPHHIHHSTSSLYVNYMSTAVTQPRGLRNPAIIVPSPTAMRPASPNVTVDTLLQASRLVSCSYQVAQSTSLCAGTAPL